jgi:O-antigen/teichoic acid export membrane protein
VGTWRGTVRSFLTLLAGEGAARALGLFSVVLLARALGPHGFGPVVFATSLLAWFWLVVDNGTQVAATPDIARDPSTFAPAVQRVLGLRIVLGLGAAAALVVMAQVASNTKGSAELYSLFAIALVVGALNPRWMALGVGQSRLLALGNVAGQAVVLGGVVLLIHDDLDLNRVPFIVAAGELTFALVLLGGLAPRFGLLLPRVDVASWRRTLRKGVPLMVGSASRGALLSFDLLVIVYAIGPGAAGYYGAAMKPVLFAGTAAGMFSLSLLASYSAASGDVALQLYRRAARSATAVAIVAAICLSLGAGLLVDAVYGDEFEPAATVLAILALRIPFMALSGVYSSVLIAGGGQVQLMQNNIAGAVVNVVGVLAAVKLAGIEGAAAVSVLSAVVILVLNVRSATRSGLVPGFHTAVRAPW